MFVGVQHDYNTATSVNVLFFKPAGGYYGLNFIFILVLHLGLFVLSTLAKVEICFPTKGVYKDFFPPKETPKDEDLIYTVSLNQRISRPIIAQLCEHGKPIPASHLDYSHRLHPRMFTITCLDAIEAANTSRSADPVTDQLVTCQYDSNNFPIYDPRMYDSSPNYSRKRCGNPGTLNSLCIKYYKNLLVVKGLYFQLETTDIHEKNLRRLIRISYIRHDNTLTHKDTEEFEIVTNFAHSLVWHKQPPSHIIANQPFDIELRIVDRNGDVITTGLDSTLFVEVSVEFSNTKYFHIETGVEGLLFLTKVMMAGDEVRTSFKNLDKIMRKRAEKGIVTFEGIRFLDVRSVVYLNATLIVPRTYVRQPDDYPDLIIVDVEGCTARVNASGLDEKADKVLEVLEFNYLCSTTYHSQAVSFSQPIDVKEQLAEKLVIVQPQRDVYKATANFEVLNLWVKIVDASDEVIHSGPDSELLITVTTDPSGVPLSKNSNFAMYRGWGRFNGAICEVIPNVTLVFEVRTSNGTILKDRSSSFIIDNVITIAYFGHLTLSGGENEPDPNAQTMARLAVEDINQGYYKEFENLKGKDLRLHSYNTHDDYHSTSSFLMDAISSGDEDSSEDIRAIIGFGSEQMLYDVGPLIDIHNIPVITTSSSDEAFSDYLGGREFQTVLPICWNSISAAVNLALMMAYRRWNKIIVIASESYPMPKAIYRKFLIFHIEIFQVFIPDMAEKDWTPVVLKPVWEKIFQTGTKIIFHYIPKPMQYFLYEQAVHNGFAPADGYQWITIEQPAREFPWKDFASTSTKKPYLRKMAGMLLVMGTYNVQGFSSDAWYHVNQKYFGMDRVFYTGIPTTRRNPGSGDVALGYDAVIILAHVFNDLYKTSDSIDGYLITQKIKEVNFLGLSGLLKFDDGRRSEFMAEVISVQDTDDPFSTRNARIVKTPSKLEMYVVTQHERILENMAKDDWSKSKIKNAFLLHHLKSSDGDLFGELSNDAWQTELTLRDPRSKSGMTLTLPNNTFSTVRYYLSKRGLFETTTTSLIDSTDVVLRTEYYVPPFSCPNGCGNQTTSMDHTIFDHGTCKGENECTCKLLKEYNPDYDDKSMLDKRAFQGHNCEIISCGSCAHGVCKEPFQCTCEPGWDTSTESTADDDEKDRYKDECSSPHCSQKCEHGRCVEPEKCECDVGFHGELCNVFVVGIVLGILLAIFILFALLFAFFQWRRRRRKKKNAAENLDWLVKWKDVSESFNYKDIHALSPDATSRGSAGSQVDIPMNVNETDKQTSTKMISGNVEETSENNYFAPNDYEKRSRLGMRYVEWKDQDCYAQKFDRPSLSVEDVELRKEILQLKDTKHANLIHFIGVCLEWPHVCVLVEIMPKGSLDQIIANSTFTLTWSFKYSLLRDICYGMEYLHNSKIMCHGRLKSTNCLVDNRWTCKISGLLTIVTKTTNGKRGRQVMKCLSCQSGDIQNTVTKYFPTDCIQLPAFPQKQRPLPLIAARSLLWTAPELLRSHSNPSEIGKGTKPGDYYSFGIILTELCCHKKPWEAELAIISLEELIRILKDVTHPANRGIKRLLETHNYDASKPLRPALVATFMPEAYTERKALKRLIDELTNEDPIRRPSFKEAGSTLNAIHPLKGELVENLIDMLEQYTNHLEDILAGKMHEVRSEKKKTEDVIARLLPATIAEQLKHNQVVKPQTHDGVTIFFSDIKGFTAIAKASKPMQVVELLNELYTLFDNIIDSYDAYKLETIGDAYCVASGIPTPNPNHAEDVTSMALDISSAVDDFPIRHLPGTSLECRIGLNSGSVVAGVLGVKMPRYCIFGMDVIIASQMESNGECKRVHISQNTADLLIKCDKFVLFYRGEMELKSIGKMKTYFVFLKGSVPKPGKKRDDDVSPSTIPSSGPSSRKESMDFAIDDIKRKATSSATHASVDKSAYFNVMGQKKKIFAKEARAIQEEPPKVDDPREQMKYESLISIPAKTSQSQQNLAADARGAESRQTQDTKTVTESFKPEPKKQ